MPVLPPSMCRACWGRLGLSPSLVIDFSLGTDFLNGYRGGAGLKRLMDRAMKNDEQEALDAARGVTAAAAIGYGDSLPAAWCTVGRTDPVVDGL